VTLAEWQVKRTFSRTDKVKVAGLRREASWPSSALVRPSKDLCGSGRGRRNQVQVQWRY
jgi:hypothetical protein